MIFPSLPLEIVRRILAFATAPTLCRLGGTCRAADDLVNEEFNFRYDGMLMKYVNDRGGFRGLLGATSSNIAGSSAALVCGIPRGYVPGDLDVYCDDRGLVVLRDHLVNKEWYKVIQERCRVDYEPTSQAVDAAERLIPITDVDRTYDELLRLDENEPSGGTEDGVYVGDAEYESGIAEVVHLQRGDAYIDLIRSATPSATFPIVKFWSTAPMCFLTGNGIHVLYPRLQEVNRALLNPFRMPAVEPEEPPQLVVRIIGKQKAHI